MKEYYHHFLKKKRRHTEMQDEVIKQSKSNEIKNMKAKKKTVNEQKIESIEDLISLLTSKEDILKANKENMKITRITNLIKSASKLSAKYEDAENVGAIVKDLIKGQEDKLFFLIASEKNSNKRHSQSHFITYFCEYINREISKKIHNVSNSDDILSALQQIQKEENREKLVNWIRQDDSLDEYGKHQILERAMLLYILIVLNENQDKKKYLEDIIIEILLSKYVKKTNHKQGIKIFQKLFLSNNIASELENYSYFLLPAKESIELLKVQNEELESDFNYLKTEFEGLNEKYEAEKIENSNHIATINKLKDNISQLSTELKEAQDRLEYEAHINKEQLKSGKEYLLSHLTRSISMEISEVRDTLNYMNTNEAERIEKRLKNIEKILTSMRG